MVVLIVYMYMVYVYIYGVYYKIFMPRGQKTKTQYSEMPKVNYVPFIDRGTL
jgi:hypothetical protein